MNLSASARAKSTPHLRAALAKADAQAPMRVVIALGDTVMDGAFPGTPIVPGQLRTAKVGSQRTPATRRDLIAARRGHFQRSYDSVRRSLEKSGLKVAGGELTRAVVLEGKAADIAAALEMPLVRTATLDEPLVQPPVIRKRVRGSTLARTKRLKPAKPSKTAAVRMPNVRRSRASVAKRS